MKYEELSSMAKGVLEKSGEIAAPLRVDLENIIFEQDTENTTLTAILDFVETVRKNPLEYMELFSLDGEKNRTWFANELSALHKYLIDVLSVPLGLRQNGSTEVIQK